MLDELRELFDEKGAVLSVRSEDDLAAGIGRGQTFAGDNPDAKATLIAAVLFDGIRTRHPLVDGNKRLAFMAAVTFLDRSGLYLDAPEAPTARACIEVVENTRTIDDLGAFFEAYWEPELPSDGPR
ncbi:MAG: hypothetical protein EA356_03570 [Geminicoccaceae bacterium]|nr:MAG: hypothetical protein EA356_03570 [Geminicoccaceae bacterium]